MDLTSEAERVHQRRALDRLSTEITDPAAKAVTQQFASGQLSARDVVTYLEHSPTGMRGFDRYLARLTRLSAAEREAMRAEHERQVAAIAEELRAARHPAPTPRPVARRRADEEEEASWEDGTWLR